MPSFSAESTHPFRGLRFSGRKDITAKRQGSKIGIASRSISSRTVEIGTTTPVENVDFIHDILAEAGLDPKAYRLSPLVRRLPACLRALKVQSVPAARISLSAHPERLAIALNTLLIGTTSFFRDATVFQQLEQFVIPDLLQTNKSPAVWSIACSDGVELYSLAMLIAERDPASTPRLLGTDCRHSALQVARGGVFPLHSLENMNQQFVSKHLIHGKTSVSVHPDLLSHTEWRHGDILEDDCGGPWDLILCRNLAIYLRHEAAMRMWQRIEHSLKPGGTLVVGKAEFPRSEGFQRIAPCIFRKMNTHSVPS